MRFQKIAPFALAAAAVSAQNTTGGGNLTTGGNITSMTNGTVPLANQQLNSFWTLLQQFGLLGTYSNMKNITLLAPSNEALARLNTSGVAITSELVQALVDYHTLNGTIMSSELSNVTSLFPHTHLTNPTYSNVTGGQVVEALMVNKTAYFFSGLKNNVSVTTANLNFTGGVIHIVDGTLTIPGNLTSTLTNSNLTALAGAAQELNMTSTLGRLHDVTIFAPNNDAFQAVGDALANASMSMLSNILSYHVVNNTVLYSSDIMNGTTSVSTLTGHNITLQNINGSLYVNSAKVVTPDVLFGNGVIQVIDEVLNPNNTVAHNSSMTATSKSSTSQAFAGVTTKASNVPFTSGQATPTTSNAAQKSATTGALSSSTGAANAFATGAIGAAALFGGIGAAFANF
ncbi:FAS1 domain-containing protein, partial [Aureobasidium melanogenum]